MYEASTASTWDVSHKDMGGDCFPARSQSVAAQARPHLALLKKKMKCRGERSHTVAGFHTDSMQTTYPSQTRLAHTFDPSMGALCDDSLQNGHDRRRPELRDETDFFDSAETVPTPAARNGAPKMARTPQNQAPKYQAPKVPRTPQGGPVAPTPKAAQVKSEVDADLEAKIAAQSEMYGEAPPPTSLTPCDSCGRKFNEKALEKHMKVCKKVFVDKRKAFDVGERRWDHVDSNERPKVGAEPTKEEKAKEELAKKKKAAWRNKSEAFRAAITCARATDDPSGPSEKSEENKKRLEEAEKKLEAEREESGEIVRCPHCDRKFNADAGKRHIPICQKTFANKGTLKKGGGTQASKTVPKAAPKEKLASGGSKASLGGRKQSRAGIS